MGSRKKPALGSYEEQLKRGHEQVSEDEVRDFLFNEQLFFVNSSNVSAIQYFPATQQMMIEYRNGSAYMYDQISSDLALKFATVHSKGSAVWDELRVRGTVYGAKKPYRKIKG